MAAFLLKRVLLALFVVIAVTLLVSYAVRLSGDPATMLMTGGQANFTVEDLERIRKSLGIDRPFLVQYFLYMKGVLHGDFGTTFFGRQPVNALMERALPATLLLALTSLIGSLVISIPLGIYAAVHRGSLADQAIRFFSLIGLSFPNFWLAIMLVLIFSVSLHLLPPSGFFTAAGLILPATTLALILSAINVRLVRTIMLDTLSMQYIVVARSKGLRERVVLYKHALRNCMIPLLTYIGLQFGDLLGGVVIIEQVFNWPGMGSLAFEAISARDYPILQGVITVLAVLIVGVNLLVDIAYGVADPRVRVE
jgi:peptide/nickel transport system permease protein